MPDPVLVADDLFLWPEEPTRLTGARCESCDELSFPLGSGCPRCGSQAVVAAALPAEGTLWTWTTQNFLPKEPYLGASRPDEFTPWLVALVELGGAIRVEGRLVGVAPEDIEFGMPLRTVVVPFTHNDEGADVLTFGFAPLGATGTNQNGVTE